MFFNSISLAVFGLVTCGQAHMKLTTPVPFGASSLDNSPLLAAGTDFPCKQRTGVYDAEGASNTMPLGSVQKLAFEGSAVHGGGSCQISVTYDEQPSASSTFKVIHSIVGGCPMKNIVGNNGDDASATDPDTYSFTVPSSLPTGTAVLAWTWFNKVGNREMYMNCAPITITAASTKRSDDEELMARNVTQLAERDQAAFNALPDMFTANIGNGCGTVSSTDLIFPDPGESVESLGLQTSSALAAPTGNCAAAVAATVATASPVATTASPVATTASPAVATIASAVSGGVFQTVPTASPAAGTTTAAPVASTAVASGVTPSATSAAAPAASTGTTGSGTAVTAGTVCTSEGMFNCVGGNSYQQCASGTWSVVMPLAAGTSCTPGQSMDMIIAKLKRSIRFSKAHIHRQLQRS